MGQPGSPARRADPRLVVAVAAGGAVGAIVRAAMERAFDTPPGGWPWGTFIANVVGSFLLGYFTTRLMERLPVSTYRRPFLGTGFCGAFTTFSTFQVELVGMVRSGYAGMAAGYASASLLAGFAAVLLASGLVRRARLKGP